MLDTQRAAEHATHVAEIRAADEARERAVDAQARTDAMRLELIEQTGPLQRIRSRGNVAGMVCPVLQRLGVN